MRMVVGIVADIMKLTPPQERSIYEHIMSTDLPTLSAYKIWAL